MTDRATIEEISEECVQLSANVQSLDAKCAEQEAEIDTLRAQVAAVDETERVIGMLATYGVSRERARSASNGLMVLMTRVDRETQSHGRIIATQAAEIATLRAQMAELSVALEKCRDTVNPYDDANGWDISMCVPSAVPGLVERRFNALSAQAAAGDVLRFKAAHYNQHVLDSYAKFGINQAIRAYDAAKGVKP